MVISTVAALAAAFPLLAATDLTVRTGDDGATLAFGSSDPFHSTPHEVEGAREIATPGDPARVVTWTELGPNGPEPWAAVFPGNGFETWIRPISHDLFLRRGQFDPLAGGLDLSESVLTGGGTLWIVQFEAPALESWRDAVRAAGGAVHHYVPDNAHIVQMDADTVPAVASLPFVRWVGEYHPEMRLDPALLGPLAAGTLPEQRYRVQVLSKDHASKVRAGAAAVEAGGTVIALNEGGRLFDAILDAGALAAVVANDDVVWVDRWTEPSTDVDLVRVVGGVDAVEGLTGFTGSGVNAEVCDSGIYGEHGDFQSNPVQIHGVPATVSTHGTNVSGIVFADGLGNPIGRGVIPDANHIFASYTPFTSGTGDRYAHTLELLSAPYNAVFQTNSWGSSQTSLYTNDSFEMDDILFDMDIVITQSQSNLGTTASRPQAWAKNIVACGGINHFNDTNLANDSWGGSASIGPAADGRIKPDLCFWYDSIFTTTTGTPTSYTTSFGGTSAATPSVAGHIGIVQEMWSAGLFGNSPTGTTVFERRAKATTVRALLVNTATQYPFTGPAHDLTRVHQGWGLPDVETMYDKRTEMLVVNEDTVLLPSQAASYFVEVLPATAELKATMCYIDLPGTTSATKHRINDLTLRVTDPGGTVYWGNVGLMVGNWSTAGGGANQKDVIENVFVQNPAAGIWKVDVIAAELNADGHVETPALDADFALVVSGIKGCPQPLNYCTAKTTSIGTTPSIGSTGFASVSANLFSVTLTDALPNKTALYFWGLASDAAPFQGGTLCIQPPLARGPVGGTDGSGAASWSVDLSGKTSGNTEYYQVWSRDPADVTGFGISLSDGLTVEYCD